MHFWAIIDGIYFAQVDSLSGHSFRSDDCLCMEVLGTLNNILKKSKHFEIHLLFNKKSKHKIYDQSLRIFF